MDWAKSAGDDIFILNGDTFFNIDLSKLADTGRNSGSLLTLALKEMTDFSRYGNVRTEQQRITGFEEKRVCTKGCINGGVYYVMKEVLHYLPGCERFSFETDFLEKAVNDIRIGYRIFSDYFIDIGVPEDYLTAQTDLPLIYEE